MSASTPTLHPRASAALVALRARGHRRTTARRDILQFLAADHGPFSVEEIHRRLRGRMDLVTVYRCLTVLEKVGLVRRCEFGDGVARYELGGDDHHHHVICRRCRKVQTLAACMGEQLEQLARTMGYSNVSHTMEVFGVCAACQKRK